MLEDVSTEDETGARRRAMGLLARALPSEPTDSHSVEIARIIGTAH